MTGAATCKMRRGCVCGRKSRLMWILGRGFFLPWTSNSSVDPPASQKWQWAASRRFCRRFCQQARYSCQLSQSSSVPSVAYFRPIVIHTDIPGSSSPARGTPSNTLSLISIFAPDVTALLLHLLHRRSHLIKLLDRIQHGIIYLFEIAIIGLSPRLGQ